MRVLVLYLNHKERKEVNNNDDQMYLLQKDQ
jgi:hypothetical protein